jgi:hypothetical protein
MSSLPIPNLSEWWPALYLIVQVIGFIAAIIVILKVTHDIIKKITSIEKDVEYLKNTVGKHTEKLEEFTVMYKTDILVRQAIDKMKEEREKEREGEKKKE